MVNSQDSKFIMENVKEIKAWIDPCEIRVKRAVKEIKDLRHPFYFIPYQAREVSLIGTLDEIKRGEEKLREFYNYRKDSP